MKLRVTFVAVLILAALATLASPGGTARVAVAQDATASVIPPAIMPATANSVPADQLNVTWPVPVTELWDKQDVQGTVDIPNLDHYLLEWQPLNDDLSTPANATWSPASGVQSKPMRDGVLATLDTTGVPDGLYSLRVSAFNKDGTNIFVVITPLRVSNARFAAIFAQAGTPTATRRPTTSLPRTPVAGVVLNGIALVPATPLCGQTYSVQVNVNNPTNTNAAQGTITVQDVNVRTGDVTASATGNFPALAAGQNSVVTVQLTSTQFYNETHQVQAIIGNSQIAASYALQQGSCNVTPAPSQTFTTVPPTAAQPTAAQPTAGPATTVAPSAAPTTAVPPSVTAPAASPTGTKPPATAPATP